jgi:predicted phage tail protein
MKNNLVKIRLHGDLACIGADWELNVNSVHQALSAINTITNCAFNDYFIKNNKLGAKYRILINGKDFRSPVPEINKDNVDIIGQTNLMYKINNLETIDIVPFIENYDSKVFGILVAIVGVVLIVVGAIYLNPGLVLAGLALVMAGTMALLARPPEFQNFRNIDKFGNQSYLFSGPTNIVGEGGPVPIGYGRMRVGSQVISSAYVIQDYQTFRDVKNNK